MSCSPAPSSPCPQPPLQAVVIERALPVLSAGVAVVTAFTAQNRIEWHGIRLSAVAAGLFVPACVWVVCRPNSRDAHAVLSATALLFYGARLAALSWAMWSGRAVTWTALANYGLLLAFTMAWEWRANRRIGLHTAWTAGGG